MKKTHSILGIIGCLVLMTACSHYDEPGQGGGNGDVIALSAVVPNGSRTTTATINDFTVYAFTGGETLMDSVTVTRNGGIWTYSPEAYWPVTPINFYAYSPAIPATPSISNEDGGDIPDYYSNGYTDLLYSVKKNVTQQIAPVTLNFRHALSKASVLLSSTNPRIKVVVSYVALNSIYTRGTFTFPQESTLASTPEVVGSWSLLKNPQKVVTFAIIDHSDKIALTPLPTDLTINSLECSYFVPQPLTELELTGGTYAGSFIEVDCEIFDTASGAKLWPNSKTPDYMLVQETETGRIVYPLTSDAVKEWKIGHAYIYNISINNPDVLDKIEFDVTVDDYIIDEM